MSVFLVACNANSSEDLFCEWYIQDLESLNEFYVYEDRVYVYEEDIPRSYLDLDNCVIENMVITCDTKRPYEDDYGDDGLIYAEQFEYVVTFKGNLEPYKKDILKGNFVDVSCE